MKSEFACSAVGICKEDFVFFCKYSTVFARMPPVLIIKCECGYDSLTVLWKIITAFCEITH